MPDLTIQHVSSQLRPCVPQRDCPWRPDWNHPSVPHNADSTAFPAWVPLYELPVLLEEERDSGMDRLIAQSARPVWVHRSRIRPTFAADDDPVQPRPQLVEVCSGVKRHLTQQRLDRHEADRCPGLEQDRQSRVRAHLVLDGRPHPDVLQRPRLDPGSGVEVTFAGTNKLQLDMPLPRSTWRPMINGIWIEGGNDHFKIRSELRSTGEISYLFQARLEPGERTLYPSNFMALVSNVLITTDVVQRHAQTETSYIIQLDLECRGHSVDIAGYGGSAYRKYGTIEAGAHPFPRYLTSSPDDWTKVASEIETDLWYAAHEQPLGHQIEIQV